MKIYCDDPLEVQSAKLMRVIAYTLGHRALKEVLDAYDGVGDVVMDRDFTIDLMQRVRKAA